MSRARYFLALVFFVPGICCSLVLSPGLWQISVQTQAMGMPVAMAPVQVTQCLTDDDAKDPSQLLGSVSSPNASGCAYSDKSYVGDRFHFAMQCSGSLALRATGDVSFTSTSLAGTIETTATLNGQPVDLTNSVSAQRVGNCNATR